MTGSYEKTLYFFSCVTKINVWTLQFFIWNDFYVNQINFMCNIVFSKSEVLIEENRRWFIH